MRARALRFRGLVFLLAALIGCLASNTEETRTINAWLNCDECIGGERAAVRALGQRAVLPLSFALLYGPPNENREAIRKQSLKTHATGGVGGLYANVYAAQMVDNFVANYQERAAIALGNIGGQQAKDALDAALQPNKLPQYRADVANAIRFARAAIDAVPYQGRFQQRSVSFGDTAFLLATPAEPFTGDELATIEGAPFPDSDIVLLRQATRLGIAAVAGPGSHLVAVRNLGTANRTRTTGLTISTVADANDRVMRDCPDRACDVMRAPIIPQAALPYTTFLSLWAAPPQRDTIDMIRFMPGAALTITAELNWSDSSNLDLLWRRCDLTPIGNSDGATTHKPEHTTETIPAGQCWVLMVFLVSRGPEPVYAQLRVKTP